MHKYDLLWLVGAQLADASAQQPELWRFDFSNGGLIVVSCLWRVVEEGSIKVTSADHGQRFGLPAPIDAAASMMEALRGKVISGVIIAAGTADITLSFGPTHQLQVIALSSGYEAWESFSPTGFHLVAQGGGQIVAFKP